MGNNHVTVLEIDLNAIEYNLNEFKSKLHPETKVMAVVKHLVMAAVLLKLPGFWNQKSLILPLLI